MLIHIQIMAMDVSMDMYNVYTINAVLFNVSRFLAFAVETIYRKDNGKWNCNIHGPVHGSTGRTRFKAEF